MSRSRPLWVAAGLGLGMWAAAAFVRRRRAARSSFFAAKVVLITGASRGIGRALAREFARRGAHLVLAARNVEEVQATAAECTALNPRIETLIVPTDVTDEAQRARLVQAALDRFDCIDILVNNAGIRQGGAFDALGPQRMRRQVEVNLLAAMHLTQLVLPAMLARGRGHIVNIASQAGRHAEPYFVTYGASKHGLIGFSEGLRREVGPQGVRVLTVSPGFTGTDMVTEIGPVYRRMGFPMIPVERVAQRTLEGIVLGLPEVNIGLLETLGGYLSVFAPRLADLYWRYLMPRDFPHAAARQFSE
jgi:short-subunit dehydrogenase